MARPGPQTFAKRQREQKKREKRLEKLEKKALRKAEKEREAALRGTSGPEIDMDAFVGDERAKASLEAQLEE
jgi:hypothetical protein